MQPGQPAYPYYDYQQYAQWYGYDPAAYYSAMGQATAAVNPFADALPMFVQSVPSR
jgi:hypothetical protein